MISLDRDGHVTRNDRFAVTKSLFATAGLRMHVGKVGEKGPRGVDQADYRQRHYDVLG